MYFHLPLCYLRDDKEKTKRVFWPSQKLGCSLSTCRSRGHRHHAGHWVVTGISFPFLQLLFKRKAPKPLTQQLQGEVCLFKAEQNSPRLPCGHH